MLTKDEIRYIRDGITAGDTFRARKMAKDDNYLVGNHALHGSAKRLGLAPDNFEEFLDTLPQDVLNDVLNEDRSGK